MFYMALLRAYEIAIEMNKERTQKIKAYTGEEIGKTIKKLTNENKICSQGIEWIGNSPYGKYDRTTVEVIKKSTKKHRFLSQQKRNAMRNNESRNQSNG